MRKLIRFATLLLAVLLLAAGLYHGLKQDEELPADVSSASLGLMLLEQNNGLYVLAVTQGSPADHSGVQPGDVLIASEEEPLTDLAHLEALLDDGKETIPLTLHRDGEVIRIFLSAR